ncbi:MAG: pilus assembly protein N-terminal domain-containing protein [Bryobacter sp.]|nr:pilus assembly protein N-terminal domain-containing protein [Bryobacter sp.]
MILQIREAESKAVGNRYAYQPCKEGLSFMSKAGIGNGKFRMALVLLVSSHLAGLAFGQSMNVVDLNMTVGKSLVIDYPVEVSRISTSSPEVVDAVPATSKEFLLHGKGHGAATVVVWAKNGTRTMYNVTVEHNTDPIKKLLTETFPGESIRVQSGRDSITLLGTVSNKEIADRAVAIATPLAKTVVSNLSITAAPVEKQIVLRVKFAELNRNKASQFGVNLLSTGAANTPGRITTGQFPAPTASRVDGTIGGQLAGTESTFTLSDALNVFAFRPDLNIGAVVRALQNEDVLQILAEPNLVTVNGKEANFLVGGEFPVPILQGGGNAGAVTIQFREFGIRLAFNPQITPNGTIKMYVKPEVSTIDLANAVTLSGFTIPALATRRMETNVELKEGQSFVVAGLLDDRVTDQMSRIPGLSSVPILGALFKSRQERKSKSELIILVTPEIIDANGPAFKQSEPNFPREFMKPRDLFKNSKQESIQTGSSAKALAAKKTSADPQPTVTRANTSSSPLKKLQHLFFRQPKKQLQSYTENRTNQTSYPPNIEGTTLQPESSQETNNRDSNTGTSIMTSRNQGMPNGKDPLMTNLSALTEPQMPIASKEDLNK